MDTKTKERLAKNISNLAPTLSNAQLTQILTVIDIEHQLMMGRLFTLMVKSDEWSGLRLEEVLTAMKESTLNINNIDAWEKYIEQFE